MFHFRPVFASADGNLAEVTEQVGKMAEHIISVNPTQLSDQMAHPVVSWDSWPMFFMKSEMSGGRGAS